MDKVQKIREEVVRLKSQLLKGACSSQIAMEKRCKEEAYDEVLTLLDSMQEEPKKCMYAQPNYTNVDRLVLCARCKEECRYAQKEADWIQELHRKLDSLSKEDFEKVWAKYAQKEEPVSEDLNTELDKYIKEHFTIDKEQLDRFGLEEKDYMYSMDKSDILILIRHFAKWQKANLWKPADNDDLPEIDREVIALLDNGKVVFAHRPPEYWDGKDIVTGKVTRHYPKTYDKGGWNIPNVKYWLDIELPKEMGL